ncbi:MAG: MgtC/SapB family protein [Oscillospiraceae bacterium]|nr:MgtC/SapB family protein [Oscillospiraceae bacterium]
MEILLSYFDLNTYLVVLVRLVASVILGGLIGIERASSKHDAGLRTHIIVCLGAASVMIVSQLITQQSGSITDITRLGAQVISGIGFLGAGSILVNRSRVRGLTTAAGLWTTGCLGLVIGAGFLEVALTIVALMMFTIYILRPFSLKIRASAMTFEVNVNIEKRSLTEYVEEFAKRNFEVMSVKTPGDKAVITIHTDDRGERNEFIRMIISIPGVTGVSEA